MAGQVYGSEIATLEKGSLLDRGAQSRRPLSWWKTVVPVGRASWARAPSRSICAWHVMNDLLHGNRETSEGASLPMVATGRGREGSATSRPWSFEESYTVIVPEKPRNPLVTLGVSVEGRNRG